VVGNLQVPKDASTAANLAMISNDCAPRDTYACSYCAALTDLDVVRDLNLVVEFAPSTNDGVLDRTAVDRGVCTDFAVITNLDATRLRNLDPDAVISGKPKSIGSNDSTRMDDDARSDQASRINRDPWIEAALIPDHDIFTHKAARTNPNILTQSNSGANHSTRLNGDPRGDNGVGRNNSLRMNATIRLGRWTKQHRSAGVPNIRVCHHNGR
jgi:hypothetical protein